MKADKKQLVITLKRSPCGCLPKHRACVKGLGLKRVNQTLIINDTGAIRGMIEKVKYLLNIEEKK